jgi:hypothetical protein
MQCEQRVVTSIAIEMRRAVGRRSGPREAALVEMRREPEARGVRESVERAALLVVEGLPLA